MPNYEEKGPLERVRREMSPEVARQLLRTGSLNVTSNPVAVTAMTSAILLTCYGAYYGIDQIQQAIESRPRTLSEENRAIFNKLKEMFVSCFTTNIYGDSRLPREVPPLPYF